MKSAQIRQKFLEFFVSKGHTLLASSPLVPGNDPTLLFTNSGMVQFKDVFTGRETRPYTRATTSQRSLRAGGKHNDLENVGYTARHHTFFEMLGNFSFGDYFKREAIHYAWELLTQIYQIPAEKLWITVYHEDDEAYKIWTQEIGIPYDRCIRIGDKPGGQPYQSDNFWQMADTGPCGPCSEIFYDHGAEVWGGPPGSPEADGDRYIEIWNLVFMQFNRDEQGVMHPLPKPSVDTGMGLERIAALLQGVHSNYDIDLFQSLIHAAARETCVEPSPENLTNNSLKVIADHIRACAFLIVDGVIPGPDGRGYVLRRIIRRAIRHGYQLGQKQAFFYRLVEDLCEVMGEAYPELLVEKARVQAILKQEEERFAETIENGMLLLEQALKSEVKLLDGEVVFKLYDTYGFPLDLTADVARERGFEVDHPGFEAAMTRQRELARSASVFKMKGSLDYQGQPTEFQGYEHLEGDATVLALYHEGVQVNTLEGEQTGILVLDRTPFYAESGGQAGDTGELIGEHCSFHIRDTQKIYAHVFGHEGHVRKGKIAVGDHVTARVNTVARHRTMANHSATHLLHSALRKVLGIHVQQRGSLVNADRTRFDFSHVQPMTVEEIIQIETLVNGEIQHNMSVSTHLMTYDNAIQAGAMALFGEKYGDEVRVIGMGGFSTELCGGTHVQRTGDIGLFKIMSETGIAAGIRRIEAVTGVGALAEVQQQEQRYKEMTSALKTSPQEAPIKLQQLLEHAKALEKELARLKSKLAASQSGDLAEQADNINGINVLAVQLDGADAKALRDTLDKLKDKLKSCVIVLASTQEGKVSLIAGVSADLTTRIKAGELVNFIAAQVGGKGGGRPDMAQAGGDQPEKLSEALASVKAWVRAKV